MAFGKRGAQQIQSARPAFATASPAIEQVESQSGFFGGRRGGESSDDFDINLGFMQPYGQDKSVIIVILLWLVLGWAGGHRFYLGNTKLGFAMLAASVAGIITFLFTLTGARSVLRAVETGADVQTSWVWLLAATIVVMLWCFIDGIYVICRMLSAKLSIKPTAPIP